MSEHQKQDACSTKEAAETAETVRELRLEVQKWRKLSESADLAVPAPRDAATAAPASPAMQEILDEVTDMQIYLGSSGARQAALEHRVCELEETARTAKN